MKKSTHTDFDRGKEEEREAGDVDGEKIAYS